jgi:hypothetical protein
MSALIFEPAFLVTIAAIVLMSLGRVSVPRNFGSMPEQDGRRSGDAVGSRSCKVGISKEPAAGWDHARP